MVISDPNMMSLFIGFGAGLGVAAFHNVFAPIKEYIIDFFLSFKFKYRFQRHNQLYKSLYITLNSLVELAFFVFAFFVIIVMINTF